MSRKSIKVVILAIAVVLATGHTPIYGSQLPKEATWLASIYAVSQGPLVFGDDAHGGAVESESPFVLRQRAATINTRVLYDSIASDTVVLNLFHDIHLPVTLTRAHDKPLWTGALQGDFRGHVTIVERNGIFALRAVADGIGTFRLRTVGKDLYLIEQIDPSRLPECMVANTPSHATWPISPVEHGPRDDTEIDLLVVYTALARIDAGGYDAIEADIQLAVDLTNLSYSNSGVATQLNLVYMDEIIYDESGTYGDHLSRLADPDDGQMDSVHALRDLYAADVVCLIVEDPEYCGMAYLAVHPDWAFSVVTWQCASSNLTLAHEIGHNQGCCHAIGDGGGCEGGGVFSYSNGHRFTGDSGTLWRTVMAYAPGNRIEHFSSPLFSYDGEPTGVPEGYPGEADNARTINETALTVANFRVSTNTLYVPAQYPTIQSAIDAATAGAEVVVSPGQYFENIDFLGKPITVRSTAPTDPTIVGSTIINGSGSGSVVTCTTSEGLDSILSGFVITGGNATYGGGMLNVGASPSVTFCTFTGNEAGSRGGGMCNRDGSSPIVTDCTFASNLADDGGGVANLNGSNPSITSCGFEGNAVSLRGGGMYNRSSEPTVTECEFELNTSSVWGGGMFNDNAPPGPIAATVIACTFTGNTADGYGGGMLNSGSSPVIMDCSFSENVTSGYGGGLWNGTESSPELTNCFFSNNSAGSDGGGIANWAGSNPILTNCTFSGNTASDYGGAVFSGGDPPCNATFSTCTFTGNEAGSRGGGMCNRDGSSPIVTDCTFASNLADDGGGVANLNGSNPSITSCGFEGNAVSLRGGGMYNRSSEPTVTECEFELNTSSVWGGGMFNDNAPPGPIAATVIACTFTGNTADLGGGVLNSGSSPALLNCVFDANVANQDGGGLWNGSESSPEIANCLFVGNGAGNEGGGMANYNGSSPLCINCTFAENAAVNGGGAVFNGGTTQSSPQLSNCVLWDNEPNEMVTALGSPLVTFSTVQGGWPGAGNIDEEPLFIDPLNSDYQLHIGSPCENAGSDDYLPQDVHDLDDDGDTAELLSIDLAQQDRVGGGVVDMGAYEQQFPEVCPDFTGDGLVNGNDLFRLLGVWGPCVGCPEDLTGDGVVNADDLFELLGAWGDC